MGLPSTLAWYVEGLEKRSGLELKLSIAKGFGRLPRDLELMIFRLVQECLTNVHRHSGTQRAEIDVRRTSGGISVEVRDHGHGMPPEKLAEVQSQGSGVGIQGMRERVRQFKGNYAIDSSDSGTRISATIPTPQEASPTERPRPLEARV